MGSSRPARLSESAGPDLGTGHIPVLGHSALPRGGSACLADAAPPCTPPLRRSLQPAWQAVAGGPAAGAVALRGGAAPRH